MKEFYNCIYNVHTKYGDYGIKKNHVMLQQSSNKMRDKAVTSAKAVSSVLSLVRIPGKKDDPTLFSVHVQYFIPAAVKI